jgi:CheY-like chemotaxis protein
MENADRAEQENRTGIKQGPGRSAKLILVTEDDPDVRTVLVDLLREAGHAVVEAANVEQALTILRAVEPALLITDVMMPGGSDGFELAMAARRLYPELKVMCISGYNQVETPRAGCHLMLQKPFRVAEILDRVAGLLRR